MKQFANKVVVITGAGAGMGRAYALEFARLGAHLALNDYAEESLQETASLVRRIGKGRVMTAAFDVSDFDAMIDFAAHVKASLGPAQVVINNAGISGPSRPALDTTVAEYERMFAINFFGVLNGTKAFLPQLVEQREATALVNVSSVFGFVGMPGASDYCAAKFAVRGFTESLMVELMETSVGVHLVHPGGIKTNIASGTNAGAEFSAKYLKTEPEDIARHVIRGIAGGKRRMVYGYRAKQTQFLTLFPLKLRTRMIFNEVRAAIRAAMSARA